MNNISDKNLKLSALRKKISDLHQRQRKLLNIMLSHKIIIKGSILLMKRECGKENCKCKKGEKHQSKYLAFSHKAKTKLQYIKAKDELEVIQKTNKYRKFRQARAELVKIQKEMLVLLNELEKEKTQKYPKEQ